MGFRRSFGDAMGNGDMEADPKSPDPSVMKLLVLAESGEAMLPFPILTRESELPVALLDSDFFDPNPNPFLSLRLGFVNDSESSNPS